MKYKESMPLTSISKTGNNLLLGGGGGNPIYGFPNRLVLVDGEFTILSDIKVKEVVVSSKVYSNIYAVVEYPSSYELFMIQNNEIKGPFALSSGVHSPVIVKDVLYYTKEGKVHRTELAKIKEKLEEAGQDVLCSESEKHVDLNENRAVKYLYTNTHSLLYKTQKNGLLMLHTGEGKEEMLDGSISSYSMNKSFAYIVQLPKDDSLITMMHEGKKWTVIEPMCITVHSEGNGDFYVGTGKGEVVAYRKGVELWRKSIFPAPVSSLATANGFLYCTNINGRVSRISTEGSTQRLLKAGLFCVGVSACVGAVRYYTYERMKVLAEQYGGFFYAKIFG